MSLSELLKPLKNLKEMKEGIEENDYGKVVKNYFESVPGVYALGKAASLIVPKVLSPTIAPAVAKGLSSAVNWYAAPAIASGKIGASMVKNTAIQAVKSSKLASNLTGAGLVVASQGLQHHVSKRLPNTVSNLEGMKYLFSKGTDYSGKQDFLNSLQDAKLKWWMTVGPLAGINNLVPLYKAVAKKRGEI